MISCRSEREKKLVETRSDRFWREDETFESSIEFVRHPSHEIILSPFHNWIRLSNSIQESNLNNPLIIFQLMEFVSMKCYSLSKIITNKRFIIHIYDISSNWKKKTKGYQSVKGSIKRIQPILFHEKWSFSSSEEKHGSSALKAIFFPLPARGIKGICEWSISNGGEVGCRSIK